MKKKFTKFLLKSEIFRQKTKSTEEIRAEILFFKCLKYTYNNGRKLIVTEQMVLQAGS